MRKIITTFAAITALAAVTASPALANQAHHASTGQGSPAGQTGMMPGTAPGGMAMPGRAQDQRPAMGTMGMMGGMMGMMGGMGPCAAMRGDLDLTVEKAKNLVEAMLIMHGNDRLRVGTVTEGEGSIIAEIETVDGSLVQRLSIDPKTGMMRHMR